MLHVQVLLNKDMDFECVQERALRNNIETYYFYRVIDCRHIYQFDIFWIEITNLALAD